MLFLVAAAIVACTSVVVGVAATTQLLSVAPRVRLTDEPVVKTTGDEPQVTVEDEAVSSEHTCTASLLTHVVGVH
jgi:hypothetical protein